MNQHFRIVGSASYLPPLRISSAELDSRLGLAPGTTFRSTGVAYRHQAGPGENAATMAKTVITAALTAAGCELRELDLLIDASLCLQQPRPCNAALIQEALGPQAAGIGCVDIHASCLGFIAAMQMVNGLFASGAAKKAMVVCSETALRGVNWNEPESACLMGDGAAAILFEAAPPQPHCVIKMETFAEGARLCQVEGGGHELPSYDFTPEQLPKFLFHMEGKSLHKLGAQRLPPFVRQALQDARCAIDALDVIPHQASGPAIRLISRKLNIQPDRLHTSIERHGNLVAASIPFVLHSVRQTKPPGARVMLLGTAAGYTQGVGIFCL